MYNANELSDLVNKKKKMKNWLDYYQLKYSRNQSKKPLVKVLINIILIEASGIFAFPLPFLFAFFFPGFDVFQSWCFLSLIYKKIDDIIFFQF